MSFAPSVSKNQPVHHCWLRCKLSMCFATFNTDVCNTIEWSAISSTGTHFPDTSHPPECHTYSPLCWNENCQRIGGILQWAASSSYYLLGNRTPHLYKVIFFCWCEFSSPFHHVHNKFLVTSITLQIFLTKKKRCESVIIHKCGGK